MNIWNKEIQAVFLRFAELRYDAIKARMRATQLKLPTVGDTFGFPAGQRTRIMNEVGMAQRRVLNRVVESVWDIIASHE
jgi:hypothetical protein